MKYISIDEKTNETFGIDDKEPTWKYPVTHKEIFPYEVTKIWYDRSKK